jgi:hypothetical protein
LNNGLAGDLKKAKPMPDRNASAQVIEFKVFL